MSESSIAYGNEPRNFAKLLEFDKEANHQWQDNFFRGFEIDEKLTAAEINHDRV